MNAFKLSPVVAAAALLMTGTASADVAETKGGITVKTDDGRFEMKIGGRIQLDAVSLDNDDTDAYTTEGGAYFRRARLSLSGKAYGWEYKFENEFADESPDTDVNSSFRDMFVARQLGPGKLTIGQFKPLRGMEELTSSNEITMLERPFTSASGLFSGRQFAIGAKYDGVIGDGITYGFAAQNNSVLKGNDSRTTEEPVVSARATWAPLLTHTSSLHVGVSASLDAGDEGNGARLRGRGKLPVTDSGTSITLAESAPSAVLAVDPDANKESSHVGLELAGTAGPFYAQGEYMRAMFKDAFLEGASGEDPGTPEDTDVDAWYVMASWLVTGETKPYVKGVYKSPKPKSAYGAWEIKARYDHAEDKDQPTSDTNSREIAVWTVGANWYVNPNVRFMLEYSQAKDQTQLNADGDDPEPSSVTLRTQFAF